MTVLDTHAWLWWLSEPTSLGKAARQAIDAGRLDGALAVSAISVWETAMLVKKGRLKLGLSVDSLVRRCRTLPFLRFVAVDPSIAIASVELGPLHDDPADRLIVATALQLGAVLVTKDQRIRSSGIVETTW